MFSVSSIRGSGGAQLPPHVRSRLATLAFVACLLILSGGAPAAWAADDQFNVSLPLTASDGVPATGAGNLENGSARDIYEFTTTAAIDLEVELSNCPPSSHSMNWQLFDTDTSSMVDYQYGSCGNKLVSALPAGTYDLVASVDGSGSTGAYNLHAYAVSDDQFSVSLPLDASNGDPSAGAGNLENVHTKDIYEFTTGAASDLDVAFSNCSGSNHTLNWQLFDTSDNSMVDHEYQHCSEKLVSSLPAGTYDLTVSADATGSFGPYELAVHSILGNDLFSNARVIPAAAASFSDSVNATAFTTESGESVPESGDGQSAWWTWRPAGNRTVSVDLYGSDHDPFLSAWVVSSGAGGFHDLLALNPLDYNAHDFSFSATAGNTYYFQLGSGDGGSSLTLHGSFTTVATPPDHFDVSLPFSASAGDPGAGAGDIEAAESSDVYEFTTTAAGDIEINLASCPGTDGQHLNWALIDTSDSSTAASGSNCHARRVNGIPAGTYDLRITALNGTPGTYQLDVAVADPQAPFAVSLPVAISDGSPAAGAGNFDSETAAPDTYEFTTSAAHDIEIELSACSGTLGDHLRWKLIDTSDDGEVATGTSCGSARANGVPAGTYDLTVSPLDGVTGTYQLDAFVVPPPEQFNVSLPFSASDGDPVAGAGNLETSVSTDVYEFTMSTSAILEIQPSNCPGYFGDHLHWTLSDTSDNSTVATGNDCSQRRVNNVPAGTYDLTVTPLDGVSGTYQLHADLSADDEFDVTLPASVSDGHPSAGAGNLEDAQTQDIYEFTTSATAPMAIAFANCSGSNQTLNWQLFDTSNSSLVDYQYQQCSGKTIGSLPAGTYDLHVFSDATGSYGPYDLEIQPLNDDQFDVTVPFSVTDGDPAAGAGNLEHTVTRDVYAFTTSAAQDLEIDFSNCSGSNHTLNWQLFDTSDNSLVDYEYQHCSGKLVSNLPAGTYEIAVSSDSTGSTGPYELTVSPPPSPNDLFGDARTILPGASSYSDSVNGTAFTTESGEAVPVAGDGQTAWWRWTPTGDRAVISDLYGSDHDPFLSVWMVTSGAGGFHDLVALNPGGDNAHDFSFTATAGNTYYFQLGSGDGGSSLTLHATFTVPLDMTAPSDGTYTQQYASLQAHLAGGAHAARFEFRTSPANAWSEIPASRLTTPSGGSVTLPLEPDGSGDTPLVRWDMPATASSDSGVGDNGINDTDTTAEVRAVALDTTDSPLVTSSRTVTLNRVPTGQVGLLDDFNRTDEGPPPSADWAAAVWEGDARPHVSDDQAFGPSSQWSDTWTHAFDADQDVAATLGSPMGTDHYTDLYARIQHPGTGDVTGYALRLVEDAATGADEWTIGRIDSGSFTPLADTASGAELSAGLVVRLATRGSKLTGYARIDGHWITQIEADDAAYAPATSQIGFGGDSDAGSLDDFRGGGPSTIQLAEPTDVAYTNLLGSLQAHVTGGGYDISFEFRTSEDNAWSAIPEARLTNPDGDPISLPLEADGTGDSQIARWNLPATTSADLGVSAENTIGDQDGVIWVRAIATSAGGAPIVSDAENIVLARTGPTPALPVVPDVAQGPVFAGQSSLEASWAASSSAVELPDGATVPVPIIGYAVDVIHVGDDLPTPTVATTSTTYEVGVPVADSEPYAIVVRAIDAAGNASAARTSQEFLSRSLDLASPRALETVNGDSVANLQARTTSPVSVCFEYREADATLVDDESPREWVPIPAGDVTDDSNTPIGAWPVPTTSAGPIYHWSGIRDLPEIDGLPGRQVEVRAVQADATGDCATPELTSNTSTITWSIDSTPYDLDPATPDPNDEHWGGGIADAEAPSMQRSSASTATQMSNAVDDNINGLIYYSAYAETCHDGCHAYAGVSANPDGKSEERLVRDLTKTKESNEGSTTATVSPCGDEIDVAGIHNETITAVGPIVGATLSNPGRDAGFELSPRGGRIAYVAGDGCNSSSGDLRIEGVDVGNDDYHHEFIVCNSGCSYPAFPDGDHLSWIDGTGNLRIALVSDIETYETDAPSEVITTGIYAAFWSHQGSTVALDDGSGDTLVLYSTNGPNGFDQATPDFTPTTLDYADAEVAGPIAPDGVHMLVTRYVGDDNNPVLAVRNLQSGALKTLRTTFRLSESGSDTTVDFSTLSTVVSVVRPEDWAGKPYANSDHRDVDLAMTYRPYLFFDSNERWQPIDPNEMLGELNPDSPSEGFHSICWIYKSEVAVGHVEATKTLPNCSAHPTSLDEAVQDVADGDQTPPSLPGEPWNTWTKEDGFNPELRIHGDHNDDGSDYHSPLLGDDCAVYVCDNGALGRMYFNRFDDSQSFGGVTYLQYWWYFRFNDARHASLLGCTSNLQTPVGPACDQHQGDWEGMTVALTRGPNPEIMWVAYSQHENFRIYYSPDLHDPAHFAFNGDHPISLVAEGTHANYPMSCGDGCIIRDVPSWIPIDWRDASNDGLAQYEYNDDGTCAVIVHTCVEDIVDAGINAFTPRWGFGAANGAAGIDTLSDGPGTPAQQPTYVRDAQPQMATGYFG